MTRRAPASSTPGAATPTDQYVPKHNPAPWFHSLIDQHQDCKNVVPLDGYHATVGHKAIPSPSQDLKTAATTPAFSWISPNNCSDAHDATCVGRDQGGGLRARPARADSLYRGRHHPHVDPGRHSARPEGRTGHLAVATGDLTSRDQSGHSVPVTARGPRSVDVTADAPGALEVRGVYPSGSAQVTWRHDGHVLGVWVFTIDLD